MLNLSKYGLLPDHVRSLCTLFKSVDGKFATELKKAIPLSLQENVKDTFVRAMTGDWSNVGVEVRISNSKFMPHYSTCILLDDAKLVSFAFDRSRNEQRINIISPLAFLCFIEGDVEKVMSLIQEVHTNIERAGSCVGHPMVHSIVNKTEGFEPSILLAMLLLDQLNETKVVTPNKNDYTTFEIYTIK